MIEKTIFILLWTSLGFYVLATSNIETPKECTTGTPDYNAIQCNETCTKDIHMNQPYCVNFTKLPTNIHTPPQQHEVHNPVTAPEVTLPEEVTKNIDLSTPNTHIDDASSGISHQYSLLLCVVCYLFSTFLI